MTYKAFWRKPDGARLQEIFRVRWQFAQPEPRWHEAVVSVPEFRSAKRPAGRVHPTRVDLYFQNGGRVVAERSLEIDLAQEKRTLLTTGPGEPLQRPAPCGMAADFFHGEVAIIRDSGAKTDN